MAKIVEEVKEIVNELVDRVVEGEAVPIEETSDVEDDEEMESDEEEELPIEMEEEMEDGHMDGVQVGGASLQVLRSREEKAKGNFRNSVTVTTLELEIPRPMMADPNGEELFADAVLQLIHRNAPAVGSQTRMKVGVIFESPEMSESVGISFKYMDKIDRRDVVQNLEDMAQSNKSPLELTGRKRKGARERMDKVIEALTPVKRVRSSEEEDFETLHNNEDCMEGPSGNNFLDGEAREAEEEEEEEGEKDKSGNVMRNNVSKDCLPHAVYQSLMWRIYQNEKTAKSKEAYIVSIRKTDNEKRNRKVHDGVRAMKKRAGLEDKEKDFTWEDIDKIQRRCFAGLYQIIVFMDTSFVPYYKGPDVGVDRKLYLLLQDGHYRGVQAVPALFNMKYYCELCETGFRNWSNHYTCPKRHRLFGVEGCDPQETDLALTCLSCRITFPSNECFNNHKRKGVNEGTSRCDHTKYCRLCETAYYHNKNGRDHVCYQKYCHRCQCPREVNHHCSMMPTFKNEKKLTRRRIFYDIENKADPEIGLQTPVMFIAWKCCKECSSTAPDRIEEAKEMTCEKCSPDGRLKVIESVTPDNRFVDVAEEMTKWLFSKQNDGAVAVAHNASGYDAQFILEKLIASNKAAPCITSE